MSRGLGDVYKRQCYDQLSQDLCVNNSPATILTFCASVYGMNDITHIGFFDIPMIANIPNLVYIAPTCKEEYFAMLDWAVEQKDHPVAIRVPATGVATSGRPVDADYSTLNRYEVTEKGSKVAILALGDFYTLGEETAELLKKSGIHVTLINPRFITGLDSELLENLKAEHSMVVTLEDGVLDGGFGEKIARFYGASDIKTLNFGLKKEFLDRYNVEDVLKANHLTPEQIAEDIQAVM